MLAIGGRPKEALLLLRSCLIVMPYSLYTQKLSPSSSVAISVFHTSWSRVTADFVVWSKVFASGMASIKIYNQKLVLLLVSLT